MRYIFYFLVAANLLFFGWRQWSAPESTGSPPAETTAPSALSTIELAAAETPAPAPLPLVSEAVASAPAATPTMPAPAPESDTGTPVAAPASSAGVASESSAAPASSVSAVSSAAVVSCRISPWTADSQLLSAWQAALSPAHSEIEQRELASEPSYLVMIAALANKDATLARLRQLKTLPIESAFIHKGEQEGGISLGLFSKLASARARLGLVQAAGVNDAVLLERKKTQTEQRLWGQAEHWPEAMQSWSASSCERDGRSVAP